VGAEELEKSAPGVRCRFLVVGVRTVAHEPVAGVLVDDDLARVMLFDLGDVVGLMCWSLPPKNISNGQYDSPSICAIVAP